MKHRILRLAKIETVSHETTRHGNVVVDNAKTVENGDFNKDSILNVFDLCLMKRELLCTAEKGRTVKVSTSKELQNALQSAEAGDTILLAGGEYEWG